MTCMQEYEKAEPKGEDGGEWEISMWKSSKFMVNLKEIIFMKASTMHN